MIHDNSTSSPTRTHRTAQAACIAACALGIANVAAGAVVPIKGELAQMLIKQSYEQGVANKAPQKPWMTADMRAVGKISLPRIGVEKIVLDGGSRNAISYGPTLMPRSAAIGMPGTSVVAAHRDMHFRFLKDVKIGDKIDAAGIDGIVHHYTVTRTEIVEWNKFAVANRQTESALALATCYPFNSTKRGTQRFVVHADEVSDRAG